MSKRLGEETSWPDMSQGGYQASLQEKQTTQYTKGKHRLNTQLKEAVRTVGKTQCSGCGRYFVGVSVFEQHRIGEVGKNRRCLSDAELQHSGFASEQRQVRMYLENRRVVETHLVWYNASDRDRLSGLWAKDEADSLE